MVNIRYRQNHGAQQEGGDIHKRYADLQQQNEMLEYQVHELTVWNDGMDKYAYEVCILHLQYRQAIFKLLRFIIVLYSYVMKLKGYRIR